MRYIFASERCRECGRILTSGFCIKCGTMSYRVVRIYREAGIRRREIKRGLTLKQAQEHCSNPETSSRTCTNAVGKRRTRTIGDWFDAYEEVT